MESQFRVTEDGIECDEGTGNTFFLAAVLRKYTSAKLSVKGSRRTTSCDFNTLYDALGLLRSLQYDVAQFNSAVSPPTPLTLSEARYATYRLSRQASAFGVRLPRASSGSSVAVPGLDALVALVESKYADALCGARALISGGVVDFAGLGELFVPGVDLVDRGAATGIFGVPTAMRVRACYTSRGKSLFGVVSTFYAAVECVVSVGGGRVAVVECPMPIAEYTGTRSTTEGMENFITLSSGLLQELTARGLRYMAMSGGSSSAPSAAFVEYTPGSFLPAPRLGSVARAPSRARGGGRMMVDTAAAFAHGVHCARSEGVACEAVKSVLKLLAKRSRVALGGGTATAAAAAAAVEASPSAIGQAVASEEEESLELLLLSQPLPHALLHLTWPVVAGFSFAAKAWGVALVAGLSQVAFNEAAFARLVMPEPRKRLIEALVMSHRAKAPSGSSSGSTDLISGKGEGAIFLLHGPPGVGKTLTAEAIAEMLHRPLYVVAMGELGTTPEALEERLLDILDLATPWQALVLIDEAEMLLESRSKGELVRNAMVCVMLRLLEYYSGILFLTTNRVESLDPAFQSRVQCALRYEALDEGSRGRIWEDLLAHVQGGVGGDVSIPHLAAQPLNGRQIKNCLQLALALSVSEGQQLAKRHLDVVMDITTAFVSETSGGGQGK